jgi:predicted regulator of Ras-like GTPase activity (Roadblock/LC7/MglB family)
MNSLLSKFRSQQDVEYAVAVAKDGQALDDDSYEGITHAAHAAYISMLAGRIGAQLGVGELRAAAIHAVQRHTLMYQQKSRLLNFIVPGSKQLGAVEQAILKILSSQN